MDILKHKAILVLIGAMLFNMVGYGFYKIVVKAATAEVKKQFEKPYSPSPYGPGLDPDKVNTDNFRQVLESRGQEVSAYPVQSTVDWRTEWEQSRATNP